MAAGRTPDWGGSTAPSLPSPPRKTPRIEVGGGWVFTDGGMSHNVSQADLDRMMVPPFAPPTTPRG